MKPDQNQIDELGELDKALVSTLAHAREVVSKMEACEKCDMRYRCDRRYFLRRRPRFRMFLMCVDITSRFFTAILICFFIILLIAS